ncbi:hypothetical protein Q5530_00275 [Saccharothrix sp. BKS2]|uniref:hypothetical protein n=1 Tax=Saccharothrix sp. BKS2 TaxID=3064400 RepID=UPI0039EB18DD
MASLAEIGRYLKGVLDKVDKAKESLAQAADLADDAFDVLSAAGTGTTRADVEQAGARFAEVRAAVYGQGGLLAMLDAGTALVRTIMKRIGAGGDAPAGPPAAGTGAVPAQPQVLAGKIEALRRELPPPVQPRTGQKTHGRFVVGDGPAASMISGNDADAKVAKDALREEGYPLPGTRSWRPAWR